MKDPSISLNAGSGMGPLVSFYRGITPDSAGRFIGEILAWDDERLEGVHDYIQWLFPTRSRSQFNLYAPVLDEDQIRDFHYDDRLRAQLTLSFGRMLRFYGLEMVEQKGAVSIQRSSRWPERFPEWLTPQNHNFLRITRILTCLRLLGLGEFSHAFVKTLLEVHESEGARTIPRETLEFWQSAAGR